MAYDARQIADEILRIAREEGRDEIGLMKLLKLIFFAHGWHLALRGRPLIKQPVSAWQYGPVVNDVYFGFRNQDSHSENLQPLNLVNGQALDQDAREMIRGTLRAYGNEDPFILSDLTHIEDGPWDRTILTKGKGKVIPEEWIKEHFENKLRLAHKNE